MIRNILAITKRDVKIGLRDFLILYIAIAPFLLALVLQIIVPSASATTVNFGVLESENENFVEYLKSYGKVEIFKNQKMLEDRILRIDDTFGVIKRDDTFGVMKKDDTFGDIAENDEKIIIEQGNEANNARELATFIVQYYDNQEISLPVQVVIEDMGWKLHPMKHQGTALLLIFVTVFGGMVITMNIVEEKQNNTLAAINVSPITRVQFIIGKAMIGFVLPIIGCFGIIFILGFHHIHFGMLTVLILSIAIISVLVGFVIGVYNKDIMQAVSSMKMIFLPVLASVFGGIFLDEKWHPLLWWSPFYWAYRGAEKLLLDQATWSFILTNVAIILLITAIIFGILSKRIKRGLN